MEHIRYYREHGKTIFTYSKEFVKAFNKNKGAVVVCCTENELQRLLKLGVRKEKIIKTEGDTMPTRKQPERVHESDPDFVLPEVPKPPKVVKKKGKMFKNPFKSKKKVVALKHKKK